MAVRDSKKLGSWANLHPSDEDLSSPQEATFTRWGPRVSPGVPRSANS